MEESYKFKLYIVEDSEASKSLVKQIELIFNEALNDNYSLEIIDILKHPELAIEDKVIASPTLIMEQPPPERRLIGNFKDNKKILSGLNIQNKNGI